MRTHCDATGEIEPVRSSAVITSVTDGDTVRLETEDGRKLKVMLACIDAPEGNVEGHGGAAARRLKELTPLGATIRLWSLVQVAGAVAPVSS